MGRLDQKSVEIFNFGQSPLGRTIYRLPFLHQMNFVLNPVLKACIAAAASNYHFFRPAFDSEVNMLFSVVVNQNYAIR